MGGPMANGNIVSGLWALNRYPHPIYWLIDVMNGSWTNVNKVLWVIDQDQSQSQPLGLRSIQGSDLPFRLLLILQSPDKWRGLPLPLDWIIIPSICSPPVQSINCYCYSWPWCDVDDDVSLSSVKWKAVKNGQRTNALRTRTLEVNRINEAPFNHLLPPSSTYPSTYNRLAKI